MNGTVLNVFTCDAAVLHYDEFIIATWIGKDGRRDWHAARASARADAREMEVHVDITVLGVRYVTAPGDLRVVPPETDRVEDEDLLTGSRT